MRRLEPIGGERADHQKLVKGCDLVIVESPSMRKVTCCVIVRDLTGSKTWKGSPESPWVTWFNDTSNGILASDLVG
jgi:hypothetical protein